MPGQNEEDIDIRAETNLEMLKQTLKQAVTKVSQTKEEPKQKLMPQEIRYRPKRNKV